MLSFQATTVDVFLPHWAGGLDAALDITITHPLQAATRAGAAATPGHAMTVAFDNKCRNTEELCREQGIKFIPIVAESLGGWHKVALEQFRKLGSALARHTAQDEGEKTGHLVKRASILLQKGLTAMVLKRFCAAERVIYRPRLSKFRGGPVKKTPSIFMVI